MQNLEKDLYDLITRELIELSWQRDYPINPEIGVWCFLEAFRNSKTKIDRKKDKAIFFLTEDILGKNYEFTAELTFDEISKGWGRRPKGAPGALYDSIYKVYDQMEQTTLPPNNRTRLNSEIRNEWSRKIREVQPREIRENMEKHLLDFFGKYQEHMLIPLSRETPSLSKPRLFNKIIEQFPIDILKAAIVEGEFLQHYQVGPCAEAIVEEGWDLGLEMGEYYPSESTMVDLFIGSYLHRLSQIKCYSVQKNNTLRDYVVSGIQAFKNGSSLEWQNNIKN